MRIKYILVVCVLLIMFTGMAAAQPVPDATLSQQTFLSNKQRLVVNHRFKDDLSGLDSIQYFINGKPEPKTSYIETNTITLPGEGVYSIDIYVWDTAGNVSLKPVAVTVDLTAPFETEDLTIEFLKTSE